MARHSGARKRIGRGWIILVVVGVFGAVVMHQFAKKKGYNGLWELTSHTISAYFTTPKDPPLTISIQLEDEAFKKLAALRDTALARGLIMNQPDSDVNAILSVAGDSSKAKMRLKGHMLDHVKGKKWSFRVHAKDTLLGMRKFSLQHPGTRNYAHEWVYHQLLKREGIISLRYDFVKLELNGEDLGVYAIEEHMGQELLTYNNRPPGPIFRFNPAAYWQGRLNELNGNSVALGSSTYASSEPEPFYGREWKNDSLMNKCWTKAQQMLADFRQGNMGAEQVFDLPKLATMHALIDIVGGHRSLDWSDIKFYYNPATDRIEPIGYESTGVNVIDQLGGTGKFLAANDSKRFSDYYSTIFSDSAFFSNYTQALERVSDKTYLDNFFNENFDLLTNKIAILNQEFPYKKFDHLPYYQNQGRIRTLLDVPLGANAYLTAQHPGSLRLIVGAVEALPVLITAISNDKTRLVELKNSILLPAKLPANHVNYNTYAIGISDTLDFDHDLYLHYRVLGSSIGKWLRLPRYSFRSDSATGQRLAPTDLSDLRFIHTNPITKEILMLPGFWIIDKQIVIPEGYILRVEEGTNLEFRGSGSIHTYSPVHLVGSEERPISITGVSSINALYCDADGASRISYIEVRNYSGGTPFVFSGSNLRINNMHLANVNTGEAISFSDSQVEISGLFANNCSGTTIKASFSDLKICESTLQETNTGIELICSSLNFKETTMRKIELEAIAARNNSTVVGTTLRIENAQDAIVSESGSKVEVNDLELHNCVRGLVAQQQSQAFAGASITATGASEEVLSTTVIKDDLSSIAVYRKTHD